MFELILNKLDGMDKRLDGMDRKFDSMDSRQDRMESKINGMKDKLGGIAKKQNEMYSMQRALEENVKVIRKGQEKLLYMFSDIQGKISKIVS